MRILTGNIRVSGWGLLSEQGLPSDDLMTAEIPVVSDETCRSAYAKAGVEIFDDFLCAGVLGIGGIDSCQMDSGGPAVKDGKLVGIVSFGIGKILEILRAVFKLLNLSNIVVNFYIVFN